MKHTVSGMCLRACVLSCSSRVQLCVTPWTVARQTPLSMGLSRPEYWSGLPCPSPGHLPDPGIEPTLVPPGLESSPNHPLTLSPWKNCVSRIQALVPKRLGTADREERGPGLNSAP